MATKRKAFSGGRLSLQDMLTAMRESTAKAAGNQFDLQSFLKTLETPQTGAAGVPINPGATLPAGSEFEMPAKAEKMAAGGVSSAPATQAPETYKPSAWSVFDRVLGGSTITEARRDLEMEDIARRNALAQREAMARALETITDPRERMAYLLNPEKLGEAYADRYKPQSVTGGNSVLFGEGGQVYTAPKVDMSGDSGVVLTPTGMTVLGQRPISQAEKTEIAKLEEARRKNDMMDKLGLGRLAVSQGQLGVARQRAAQSGGGGGAPSGGATRVSTQDQLTALPSGALYIGPDGVTRRKP